MIYEDKLGQSVDSILSSHITKQCIYRISKKQIKLPISLGVNTLRVGVNMDPERNTIITII